MGWLCFVVAESGSNRPAELNQQITKLIFRSEDQDKQHCSIMLHLVAHLL